MKSGSLAFWYESLASWDETGTFHKQHGYKAKDDVIASVAYLKDAMRSWRICGTNPSKSSIIITTGGRETTRVWGVNFCFFLHVWVSVGWPEGQKVSVVEVELTGVHSQSEQIKVTIQVSFPVHYGWCGNETNSTTHVIVCLSLSSSLWVKSKHVTFLHTTVHYNPTIKVSVAHMYTQSHRVKTEVRSSRSTTRDSYVAC